MFPFRACCDPVLGSRLNIDGGCAITVAVAGHGKGKPSALSVFPSHTPLHVQLVSAQLWPAKDHIIHQETSELPASSCQKELKSRLQKY